MIFKDKGYMSTSLNSDFNIFKSFPVRFNIEAKKGQKAYMTNNFEESEIILLRDTSLIIKNIVYDKKRKYF